MENEPAQLLLLIMDVALVLLLAVGLICGLVIWSRHRGGPKTERARDRATARVYRETEQQERKELAS
jgi:hypothetical protein